MEVYDGWEREKLERVRYVKEVDSFRQIIIVQLTDNYQVTGWQGVFQPAVLTMSC